MTAPSTTAQPFAVRRRRPSSVRSAPSVPFRRKPQYTSEEIVEAIRRWAAEYGEPPTLADWEPSRARRLGQDWRAERYQAGSWPSVRMARRHFSTFGDAIAEAGFPRPRRRGTKARLSGPEEVLRAIREWTTRYGEPPNQADWDPVRARNQGQEWRVARYRDGDWPSLASVRFHFATLSDATREAGLTPASAAHDFAARIERRRGNDYALAELAAAAAPAASHQIVAGAVRDVAAARLKEDSQVLRQALLALAAAALGWADALSSDP
jgi:hypothetical protein